MTTTAQREKHQRQPQKLLVHRSCVAECLESQLLSGEELKCFHLEKSAYVMSLRSTLKVYHSQCSFRSVQGFTTLLNKLHTHLNCETPPKLMSTFYQITRKTKKRFLIFEQSGSFIWIAFAHQRPKLDF